jgi:hypothetical protein
MTRDPWNSPFGPEADDEDGLEDPEGPQPIDLPDSDADDEYDVVPCPHCGREILELTERCPHCGDWIVAGGGSRSRRHPLWIVIAIVLVALLLLWLL